MMNNQMLLTKIKEMYSWCRDSMINSFLEGIIGNLWSDDYNMPQSAAIFIGDFVYLSGKPCSDGELIAMMKQKEDHSVIVPQSDDWYAYLISGGLKLKKTTRFYTAIPESGFSKENLDKIIKKIDHLDNAVLKKVDEEDYYLLKDCTWENGFVSNFKDYNDYSRNGFGYIIYIDGEIASCTSTFGYYSKGVEIQVATNPKYRQKGLAAICSTAFVAYALEINKIPHWDAGNLFSLRIAQKLGYVADGEYIAYEHA